MNLDQQFKKIISSTSFIDICPKDFKSIALGIWYEDYTPNLDNLESHQLQKAGYIIDRLMRFNCVSKERYLVLLELMSSIPITLVTIKTDLTNNNIESLAIKWNLNEDISHLVQTVLPFQTRHYMHSLRSKK
jgi:hypothetical protein